MTVDDSLDALDTDSTPSAVIYVQASSSEVNQRLKTDYNFFAEFFLADQLDRKSPEFHTQTWEYMTSTAILRVLLAIPREHAKTTQAKLSVVWHFMFTERRFCVYLSNTNAVALAACKDIFEFFKCPNYVALYGPIVVETESEGRSLWKFTITLFNGRKKKCILRATGANQQMRGINIDNQRPDLAVVDDVEDLENTESEHLQKKLDKWMFATFIKALTKEHKIIWIGNMLRKTSLLARLATKGEFKERWTSLVLGAIIRNPETGEFEPLWPELWSMNALRVDYQEYVALNQAESWFCEMMNLPGVGEHGFQMEDMHYTLLQNPEDYLATFITIEPAFGLNAHNDSTAIVVHGIPKTGIPHVIAYRVGKFIERQMFDEAMALSRYWKSWTWGIERVAAQKVLLTLFELYLLKAQEYRVVLMPLMPSGNEAKASRITAFVNLMKSKEYALPSGDIDATTQFLGYDVTMKEQSDDLVDGIAYGPQMLQMFRWQILENAQKAANMPLNSAQKAQTDVEVACV